jgi:hypothetical protein
MKYYKKIFHFGSYIGRLLGLRVLGALSGPLSLYKRKLMSGEGPVNIDFTGPGPALDAMNQREMHILTVNSQFHSLLKSDYC